MVVNGMVWITITIMDVNKKCQKKMEDFKINLYSGSGLDGASCRIS